MECLFGNGQRFLQRLQVPPSQIDVRRERILGSGGWPGIRKRTHGNYGQVGIIDYMERVSPLVGCGQ